MFHNVLWLSLAVIILFINHLQSNNENDSQNRQLGVYSVIGDPLPANPLIDSKDVSLPSCPKTKSHQYCSIVETTEKSTNPGRKKMSTKAIGACHGAPRQKTGVTKTKVAIAKEPAMRLRWISRSTLLHPANGRTRR